MNIDLLLFSGALFSLFLLLMPGSPIGVLQKRPAPAGASVPEQEEAPSFSYLSRLAIGAGFSPMELRPWYWIYKIIFTAGVGALALPHLAILWVLCLMFIGLFIPDLFLLWLGRKRKLVIINGLAFYLDLVISFLFSGLPAKRAFLEAREAYAPRHPLVEEISRVALEWQMGETPGQAFSNLAARTKIIEFELIAVALNLSSKHGTPLYETLMSQSKLIREKRGQAAEKKLQQAMLKMTLAVMLAGLPLFYVIIFYPMFSELRDFFEFSSGSPF